MGMLIIWLNRCDWDGAEPDVNHIAFSALSKFDGRRMRPLAPNELAQIAGVQGAQDGTFGITGEPHHWTRRLQMRLWTIALPL